MSRTHNVQTPGDTSKPDAETKAPATPVPPSQQATPAADTETAGANDAATEAPKTTHKRGPLTKADYANMRAEDVDATKLTAPVLTRDGYVVPAPKDAK